MHIPKRDHETGDLRESYAAKELSRYDMEVAGVVVYMVMMLLFFIVALVMMLFRNELATQARAHSAKPVIVAAAELSAMSTRAENAPAFDVSGTSEQVESRRPDRITL